MVLLYNPAANVAYPASQVTSVGAVQNLAGSWQYVITFGATLGAYTSQKVFATGPAAIQAAADLISGVVTLT